VAITGIDFFNTQFIGGAPATGAYDLSLSYTSKPVGALDTTNPANNITSGSQPFSNGSLPGLSGGMLDFTGTPFSYDPAGGNLLLTVTISGGADGSPILYLDQAQTQLQTSFAFFGTVQGGNFAGGLVTEFVTSTVPEPSLVFPLTAILIVLRFGLHKRRWEQIVGGRMGAAQRWKSTQT